MGCRSSGLADDVARSFFIVDKVGHRVTPAKQESSASTAVVYETRSKTVTNSIAQDRSVCAKSKRCVVSAALASLRFAMPKSAGTQQEYSARINRVIDFIEANYAESLQVEELAKLAHFSRFHFQRIFKSMTGESLYQFILRIRLERAALALRNPAQSVTVVAIDCGFSSSATFARAFKKKFGVSASEWRDSAQSTNCKLNRIQGDMSRSPGNAFRCEARYSIGMSSTKSSTIWRITMPENNQIECDVVVKEQPEYHVAYVRHVGPYAGDTELFGRLFEQLIRWLGARDLLGPDTQFITIAHDDPKVTEESKLRISVCATVPKGTNVTGEIGSMTIPNGKYAVARFETSTPEIALAWEAMFSSWLPQSGYQPDDRSCYEICHNDPKTHPEHKHIYDICIPVKAL